MSGAGTKTARTMQAALVAAAVGFLASEGAWAGEALCAVVKIQIVQELTLERQAFDAHMRINNGLSDSALTKVKVEIVVTDDDGNEVPITSDPNDTNAFFFVRVDSMENINDVSGSGIVQPSTSADIHWLMIPAFGAGGSSPQGVRYNVGAKLTYELNGAEWDTDVVPDTIVVKPMPLLVLDYFLPSDVYGDDAFTPEIEPPIPFSLGVRVRNAGYGTANQLRIESGQPKIVENQLGLLIGFKITGSEVQGDPATDSLLVDFGDIAAGAAKVARWIMEVTLSGRFIEFTAEFTHADELGGLLTSLIDHINTHFLIHDVLVDLPGRDDVKDFLAAGSTNYEDFVVYESDNVDTAVTNLSAGAVLTELWHTGSDWGYSLAMFPAAGPLYVQKTFPRSTDSLVILYALRSDGKLINANNVWFSKRRSPGNPWEYYLNLFDVNGGGTYTIVIRDTSALPQAPVLGYIGDKVGFVGDPLGLGFLVQASDPNGTIPELLTTPLPAGATFEWVTNGTLAEGTFFWRPEAGQEGIYPVKFTASDGELTDSEQIRIYVGASGEPTNAAGIPVSLADRAMPITNIVACSTQAGARVEWASIPGIVYDVWRSDDAFGPDMNWTKALSNYEASVYNEHWNDPSLTTSVVRRFYQVVLQGETPWSNGTWGVMRSRVAGRTQNLIAPPLWYDRAFNGGLGRALAEVLLRDNAGAGDGVGDDIGVLETNGAWRLFYVDNSGTIREATGVPSTYALPAGLGMIITRNASSTSTVTFVGEVGNTGSRQVVVRPGWNLLALSEGRTLTLSNAFAQAGNGGPRAGTYEEEADQIVLWTETGQGYWLMLVDGWGPPYDGHWVDMGTLQIPNVTLRPGQVIYYYRQPVAGEMPVNF